MGDCRGDSTGRGAGGADGDDGAAARSRSGIVDVIDVLDSDDEVRRAKTQSRENNPLNAPEVDLTNYNMVFVEVDAEKIIEPPLKVRCVEVSHVRTMECRLGDDGYLGSSGSISVALQETASVDVEEILRSGEVHVQVWLVDGRHRLLAIRRLALRTPHWKKQAEKVRVGLWLPKEAQQRRLSFTEILNLGAYLNNASSTNRAMSFQDQIHACVSLAKLLDEGEGVDIQTTSSSALASALCVGKTLGDQKMRQLQRYALVALKLAQNAPLFDVFIEETKGDGKVSLVHVSSDVLLGFDVEAFRLGLRCIKARLSTEGDKKAMGKFEQMAREFFLLVGLMYEEVAKAARFKETTVPDIMKRTVVVGNDSFSVSGNICFVMSRFRLVSNGAIADQRRLNTLKKRLKVLVGDYEAEPVDEPVDKNDCADGSTGTPCPLPPDTDEAGGVEVDGVDGLRRSGRHTGSDSTTRAPDAGVSNSSVPGTALPTNKGRLARPKLPVISRHTPRSKKAVRTVRARTGRRVEDSDSESIYDVPEPRPKKRRLGTGSGRDGASARTLVRTLQGIPRDDIVRAMGTINLDVVPRGDDGGASSNEENEDDEDQKFDDTIPSELPIGYEDPTPYKGPDNPVWCQYARRLPSQWPKENPIEHTQPFLEALFIPHQHRGNIFIRDKEILRRNHHMVFWRAAHNYFRAHKEEIPPSLQVARCEDVSETMSTWSTVISTDYMAKVYFAGKREELENKGFCILESFLDDGRVPESVIAPVGEDKDMFKKLRAFFSSTFPGEMAIRNPDNRKIWNWIVNDGRRVVDEKNGLKGIGRYITTNVAVTTDIEQSESDVCVAVSRAFLDLRIAQIMAAVVPWDNTNLSHEKMSVPNTGGRWMLTGKSCQRQTLHTDFPTMSRKHVVRGTKNPGYFTVTTGEMEVPLWVCPYSHKMVAMASESSIRALSRGSVAGRVRIPPYSIFVGRGDLFHGGAAAQDSSMKDGDLRYHLYFVPHSHALPNAVHLMSKFQPVFRKNVEESTDDDGDEDDDDGESECE